VVADFYSREKKKAQVAVQHSKLPTPQAAEIMKAYWAAQLESLHAFRFPAPKK
jgi:hypothetical protein